MAEKIVSTEDAKNVYFFVLPALPFDGKQLFDVAPMAPYLQNATGYSNATQYPSPYVIYSTADVAHAKAQLLAKQHNCSYYVAKLNILGMYVPPPAEWKPTYQEQA